MLRARLMFLLFSILLGSALPVQSSGIFSHSDWQEVLERFVDDRGLVNYRALAEDREILDHYVETLRDVSPETHEELFPTRNHQLAYYLNAYNAFVFVGVLALGPETPSVWGKSGLGIRFFTRQKYEMGGRRLSLKKLEDELIREGFRNPRVHAALNCASLGCPRLPRQAFDGELLSSQLDAAMREWVVAARAVSVDEDRRVVALSKIFGWFRQDFLQAEARIGERQPSLIGFINRYRPQGEEIPDAFREEIQPYDKRLNGRP